MPVRLVMLVRLGSLVGWSDGKRVKCSWIGG